MHEHPDKVTKAGSRYRYPYYIEDAEVLGLYEESILDVRGAFFYPRRGFRDWHTNGDVSGWRVYCVDIQGLGSSSFRFKDREDGKIITIQDRADHAILFRTSPDDDSPLWHAVFSDRSRLSLGFMLIDQMSHQEFLNSLRTLKQPLADIPWCWWIRAPLWNSRREVAEFLFDLQQNPHEALQKIEMSLFQVESHIPSQLELGHRLRALSDRLEIDISDGAMR